MIGSFSLLTADGEPRRLFALVQAGKALVGALLGLGFVLFIGRPDLFESLAIGGLVAPFLLALAALAPIGLPALEFAGLAWFALLIGYLAALTGGMQSPLMVWLVLVPAEAALAGGRRAVAAAAVTAAIVLLAVWRWCDVGQPAASRLPVPAAGALIAPAILAALVQAGVDRGRGAGLDSVPPTGPPRRARRCTSSWPTMRWT